MLTQNLTIDHEAIAAFCERNHIQWLAIFGSAVRGDFGPNSDVDVIVEFEPGKTPGLAFFGLPEELSPILGGRQVDLGTRKSLNRWIKDRVLREAVTLFSNDSSPPSEAHNSV